MAFPVELPLRAEYFLSPHFAFNAEVGLALVIQDHATARDDGQGVALGLGTTLLGGAGFNYYF